MNTKQTFDILFWIEKRRLKNGRVPIHVRVTVNGSRKDLPTHAKPMSHYIELEPVKQKSGKTVYAWAVEGDFDTIKIKSNSFEIEWPPKSGIKASFSEVDKAEWFNISDANKNWLMHRVHFSII